MLHARTLPVGLAVALVLAVAPSGGWSSMRPQPVLSAALTRATPGPPAGSPDLSVPVKTERGRVTVTLTRESFREGETVRAVVANGLPGPIYTADSKTDCSIVLLERWTGKAWETVQGCALGRAPVTVAIGPGRGRLVVIDPFSLHLRLGLPETAKPALRTGKYRIRFTYRIDRDPEEVEPRTALSATFIIRP